MKTQNIDEQITFHKVKNEMPASSGEVPYLGKVELKGTIEEEAFIVEMREDGCTESAESIRRILRGADAVQAMRIGEKGNKVQTGTELMMPHLEGTLPAPDAKPGEGNALTVRIDVCDSLRNALSDMTPKEDRSMISKLGGVRIYSVKSEGLDWSELKGTTPFQIIGIGFKPTSASAIMVSVVSQKTGAASVAAATCDDNQRIVAQLGEVLPKGQYKVVVKVSDEGGVSGNDEASYNVKMLAAPAPVPPPKKTLRFYPTAIAAKAGVDPLTEIDRSRANLYLRAEGKSFAEGETLTATLEAPGLDEPETHELEIGLVDGAPAVTNPFAGPIHASLTGRVTLENDEVIGEVAFVPEV